MRIDNIVDFFKNRSLYFKAFSISLICIFLVYIAFSPNYETNDDVYMSIIAHDYGISSQGMPNILFSNVL